MSIHEMLQQLEGEGKLVRFLPPDGVAEKRQLFLTSGLYQEFSDRRSSFNFFGQMPAARIAFGRWVTGNLVTVRLGLGNTGAELARLEPPPEEIWEFRITEPVPQLRVFARFAAPDILVATAAVNRDRLGRAFSRSQKQNKAWTEAMYGCISEWTRLFGRTEAFRGRVIADYVSENCLGP